MSNQPNVLTGKPWNQYLEDNNFTDKSQTELYNCTHNSHAIYKLGDYYFCFAISGGYKNLSALKSLITKHT